MVGQLPDLQHLPDPSPPHRPVGDEHQDECPAEKKLRKTEREMTNPLFLLRCVQLGISITDLDLLTVGLVNDMFPKSSSDKIEWKGVGQSS